MRRGFFDFIYDTVSSGDGPDLDYERFLRPLLRSDPTAAPHACYVALNSPNKTDWLRALSSHVLNGRANLLRSQYDLVVFQPTQQDWQRLRTWFEEENLLQQSDNGSAPSDRACIPFKPIIDAVFSFSEEGVNAALERMKSRRAVGKVVVAVGAAPGEEGGESAGEPS
eukprot:g17911.t1